VTATILLIEDNPITTKLVKFALENAHYTVIEAADGATGLRWFEEGHPHLVLLDMLLPDTDGYELFRRMRLIASRADVPILAFSGMLSAQDEARMAESGFDDVVSKPVEPSRLLQIIRGHLPPVDAQDVAVINGEPQRTVVIADDDSVQRKMVGLRIQRAGFKIVMTADGQEALDRARAVKPYAIVSDVLMPKLDGFGLCMAVRNDPVLAHTPVLLISNSYLDAEDKSLATRAGADELLLRTPDLKDVIAALKSDLASRVRTRTAPEIEPALEQERIRRMMSQLDKQVTAQVGLSQRCALLSAELSVLSGISEAVATEENIETALHTILASCFDAGGISLGTLYLVTEQGLHGVRFGVTENGSEHDVETFFGAKDLLVQAISGQTLIHVPSEQYPAERFGGLLARTGARAFVIAPLGYKNEPLGALVAMSRLADAMPADSVAFVQAVASQISLALTLARSFQAKDASERQARNNAAVLKSILDSMAEGVIVTNERGVISHANQAASSILRRPLATIADVAGEQTDSPIVRGLRGERVDHAEMSIAVTGEGAERWLSVNARPLDADTGVAVFRDVTDEKAANARMLVTERMASLGTLAAGVGHEINNPLMAVLGNLDMAIDDLRQVRQELTEHPILADTLDELQDARDAADRVRNIVRDLKLFSRQDREDTRTGVDVTRVVESSARMVWNEIRHRANLVRDFQPVPLIDANESRIGQVVLNLLVNAAHAIPEGRASENEIVIGTRVSKDGRVVVFVRDTGVGMSPATIEKIFVPFFTTKPIGVGTGLGLSICHQIVSSLGGEIVVDSKVGSGTTFSVLLPPAHASVGELSVELVPRTGSRRGRVLIIDDDPIVATTITRVLARDHETVCLTSSKEAARLIATGAQFDVILCDLMMPDLTGMDLYAELGRTAPEQAARMIFLTGGAFTTAAREFLATTSNTHLEKPISPESLRALVAGWIRSIDGRTA
jgi:CheY-like chemotaxis protein